jgi:hypothetical protein
MFQRAAQTRSDPRACANCFTQIDPVSAYRLVCIDSKLNTSFIVEFYLSEPSSITRLHPAFSNLSAAFCLFFAPPASALSSRGLSFPVLGPSLMSDLSQVATHCRSVPLPEFCAAVRLHPDSSAFAVLFSHLRV